MKEFNEKHIKDLQEADGFVLQNVYGNTVAIYLDSLPEMLVGIELVDIQTED